MLLLDDRIGTLNRNAVETSPAKPIFRTVGAILALIRVSALILRLPVNSHWWPNQDKAVDNKDSVQLSEYYLGVCEALEATIQGKNVDDLDESVRMALKNMERCVD